RQTVAAALAKPPVATPIGQPARATRPQRPRIETVTMNGFHIVRTSAEEHTTAKHPGVYHFLVRDPKGQEQDVMVQVDAGAVAMVERLIRRSLPITGSFWKSYAEHTLATYVWDEGRIPWGGATFNLKTPECGHHILFLSQHLHYGGGNRHDDRTGRICTRPLLGQARSGQDAHHCRVNRCLGRPLSAGGAP